MEIDKLIEGADIVRFIKTQRIKWLGHIQRMDQARPARKLLDWKPIGIRPVGRPRQRWQEDVMEDLKKLYSTNVVCFRYITVNTLHKVDNKENNNNNNNNNKLLSLQFQLTL
jgi:hypothetical protein